MASTGVWVVRDGELVPKHLATPLHRRFGAGPMIRTDGMDATWNPVNGRHYDSKSEYEKAVKAAGCEIIGGTMPKPRPPVETSEAEIAVDVKRAVETVLDRQPKRKKGKKRGI